MVHSSYNFSDLLVWSLRISNSCIALLNILGNSFLIYALKKTGQITNMSLQLIVLMSVSDCINGVVALSLTNILLWKEYDSICYLRAATQFMHNAFLGFSFTTVLLIAIDRFLHIKYQQRYPIIATKRRGTILLLFVIFCEALVAFVSSMPFLDHGERIGNIFYLSSAPSTIISVAILYYKTFKIINRRVISMNTPVMKNTFTHNKRIMNAALSISMCMIFTLTPYIIVGILSEISMRSQGKVSKELVTFKWFTYLFSLANGVCSCIIFIAQSRPVKRLLKDMINQR